MTKIPSVLILEMYHVRGMMESYLIRSIRTGFFAKSMLPDLINSSTYLDGKIIQDMDFDRRANGRCRAKDLLVYLKYNEIDIGISSPDQIDRSTEMPGRAREIIRDFANGDPIEE